MRDAKTYRRYHLCSDSSQPMHSEVPRSIILTNSRHLGIRTAHRPTVCAYKVERWLSSTSSSSSQSYMSNSLVTLTTLSVRFPCFTTFPTSHFKHVDVSRRRCIDRDERLYAHHSIAKTSTTSHFPQTIDQAATSQPGVAPYQYSMCLCERQGWRK